MQQLIRTRALTRALAALFAIALLTAAANVTAHGERPPVKVSWPPPLPSGPPASPTPIVPGEGADYPFGTFITGVCGRDGNIPPTGVWKPPGHYHQYDTSWSLRYANDTSTPTGGFVAPEDPLSNPCPRDVVLTPLEPGAYALVETTTRTDYDIDDNGHYGEETHSRDDSFTRFEIYNPADPCLMRVRSHSGTMTLDGQPLAGRRWLGNGDTIKTGAKGTITLSGPRATLTLGPRSTVGLGASSSSQRCESERDLRFRGGSLTVSNGTLGGIPEIDTSWLNVRPANARFKYAFTLKTQPLTTNADDRSARDITVVCPKVGVAEALVFGTPTKLRPGYRFTYRQARPNPIYGIKRGGCEARQLLTGG
jgi:hypothetical protein